MNKPNVLQSSYQSQPFEVHLLQEGAIDQGGPYRDCLMQVVTDTQGDTAKIPLFIHSSNTSAGYIPNPTKNSQQSLDQFTFVGMLLGMCLRTGDCLPYHFASIIWKTLARESITLSSFDEV